MDVILGFVFLCSLLFLGMIFGDRLSLFGNVDDRWLLSPFELVTRFWDMLCELFDRMFCFVSDHFWWVAATASGTVGITLIAVLMFSGLTLEAAAVRRDEMAVMRVGGVLDHTPQVDASDTMPRLQQPLENSTSHLVDQTPSRNRFVIREFRKPELERIPNDPPYVPVTETEVSYQPTPNPFRARLHLSSVPFTEIQGQPIRDPLIDQMIVQTVRDLREEELEVERLAQQGLLDSRDARVNWEAFSEFGYKDRQAVSRADLPEDSPYDVDTLLQSVRILPGEDVTSQWLDVRKQMPENPPPGEFNIRILIQNMGRDTLTGLVVRELIPYSAVAKDMLPRGAYRDNTAVWVVNDLRPNEERELVLTVEGTDQNRFESVTEVSAASAIRTTTNVEEPRRWDPIELPPVREEAPRRPIRREPIPRPRPEPEPEPIRLPDVRLRLLTDPVAGEVDEVLVVNFEVRNIGDADAEGVSLRINLPQEIDHKDLDPRAELRRVESNVRILKPQESRRMTLRIRPNQRGLHFMTAQLMLKNTELDIQGFDVAAGQLSPSESRRREDRRDSRTRSLEPGEGSTPELRPGDSTTPRNPFRRRSGNDVEFPSFESLMPGPTPDPNFR